MSSNLHRSPSHLSRCYFLFCLKNTECSLNLSKKEKIAAYHFWTTCVKMEQIINFPWCRTVWKELTKVVTLAGTLLAIDYLLFLGISRHPIVMPVVHLPIALLCWGLNLLEWREILNMELSWVLNNSLARQWSNLFTTLVADKILVSLINSRTIGELRESDSNALVDVNHLEVSSGQALAYLVLFLVYIMYLSAWRNIFHFLNAQTRVWRLM